MSALSILTFIVNAVVIAGCAWCLWSPLPRKILRNGQSPILQMIRVFAIVLLLQAGVRIAVEAFEPSEITREILRLVIGIVSLAAVIMLVRFIRWVIERALVDDTTEGEGQAYEVS